MFDASLLKGLSPRQAEELDREMQRLSPLYFATRNLGGNASGTEVNGRFIAGPHHIEWDRLVTASHARKGSSRGKRILVLAPRDHGKSAYFNKALPIWKGAYGNKGDLGYIFSVNQQRADEMLALIVQEIVENPKLQYLAPQNWSSRWSARRIVLTTGVEIRARGFGVSVRGGHPHWAVNDDVLSDDNITSETVRKKDTDYFLSAITNMVIPGGDIYLVGCVTADTMIATEGGLRRIGDMRPNADEPSAAQSLVDLDVGLFGRDGAVHRSSKFWVNGRCPTKKVTLECGFRIEGSHRHPLLVMGEDGLPVWRRSDEVRPGDFVALRAGLNAFASREPRIPDVPAPSGRDNDVYIPSTVTPAFAYFLGLWTAEGSYEKNGRIGISNTDMPIRDYLASSPFGLRFMESATEGSEQTMRASSKRFLRAMDLCGVHLGKAPTKCIPRLVLEGTRLAARSFLQGLFDGDGSASVLIDKRSGARNLRVVLSTTSERLSKEVQQLLLNFGIVASAYHYPPPPPTSRAIGKEDQFPVVMTAGEAVRFMREIGFTLDRKQALLAKVDAGLQPLRGIPRQGALISRMRDEKPRVARGGVRRRCGTNAAAVATAKCPSVSLLKEVHGWFVEHGARGPATDALGQNITDGFVWLEVRSVADGEAETFDFVVPEGHSFIGNGIVNHNTPMNEGDLYADLEKRGAYTVWKKPALDVLTGKALWPARYTKDALLEKREEIGSARFTREFQVRPFSDDMSLFPTYLFDGKPVRQPMMKMGMNAAYWNALGVTQRYMGVDLAISSETGADYFVIVVIGKDAQGNRWLCDIVRHKGVGFRKQLDIINTVGRRLDPSLIFIEANQMQRVWGDELIKETDLPIKKFITTGRGKGKTTNVSQSQNKNSLEAGVASLVPLFENKKFRLPVGDGASVELIEALIHELQAMSFVDGKVQSVGAHDDMVMALWIADQAVRRGGFSASFGEAVDPNFDPDAGVASAPRPSVSAAEDVAAEESRFSASFGESGSDTLWAPIPFYGNR